MNGSSPPPINWSTRPRGYNRQASALDGSQDPSSTSGDRQQLQLLFNHLSRSNHLASRRTVNNQQDGADTLVIESDRVDIPVATSNPRALVDGRHSPNESEFSELTSAFSRLFTSIDTAPLDATPLVPRAAPGFPPFSLNYQPVFNARYYVVVKGKCTGVYYGNWYACVFFSNPALLR